MTKRQRKLHARANTAKHREAKRAAGVCINSPLVGRTRGAEHGHVVKSGKCERCIEVHRKSR